MKEYRVVITARFNTAEDRDAFTAEIKNAARATKETLSSAKVEEGKAGFVLKRAEIMTDDYDVPDNVETLY
jgi:hypothetical protein